MPIYRGRQNAEAYRGAVNPTPLRRRPLTRTQQLRHDNQMAQNRTMLNQQTQAHNERVGRVGWEGHPGTLSTPPVQQGAIGDNSGNESEAQLLALLEKYNAAPLRGTTPPPPVAVPPPIAPQQPPPGAVQPPAGVEPWQRQQEPWEVPEVFNASMPQQGRIDPGGDANKSNWSLNWGQQLPPDFMSPRAEAHPNTGQQPFNQPGGFVPPGTQEWLDAGRPDWSGGRPGGGGEAPPYGADNPNMPGFPGGGGRLGDAMRRPGPELLPEDRAAAKQFHDDRKAWDSSLQEAGITVRWGGGWIDDGPLHGNHDNRSWPTTFTTQDGRTFGEDDMPWEEFGLKPMPVAPDAGQARWRAMAKEMGWDPEGYRHGPPPFRGGQPGGGIMRPPGGGWGGGGPDVITPEPHPDWVGPTGAQHRDKLQEINQKYQGMPPGREKMDAIHSALREWQASFGNPNDPGSWGNRPGGQQPPPWDPSHRRPIEPKPPWEGPNPTQPYPEGPEQGDDFRPRPGSPGGGNKFYPEGSAEWEQEFGPWNRELNQPSDMAKAAQNAGYQWITPYVGPGFWGKQGAYGEPMSTFNHTSQGPPPWEVQHAQMPQQPGGGESGSEAELPWTMRERGYGSVEELQRDYPDLFDGRPRFKPGVEDNPPPPEGDNPWANKDWADWQFDNNQGLRGWTGDQAAQMNGTVSDIQGMMRQGRFNRGDWDRFMPKSGRMPTTVAPTYDGMNREVGIDGRPVPGVPPHLRYR